MPLIDLDGAHATPHAISDDAVERTTRFVENTAELKKAVHHPLLAHKRYRDARRDEVFCVDLAVVLKGVETGGHNVRRRKVAVISRQ